MVISVTIPSTIPIWYAALYLAEQSAKDLSISKPNMTPIIDKLVNEGYVERYCDDNDRRVILIKHTKSACNLFKSLEEQVKINIYNKIKNLNEDELNKLSESIDNILKLIPKIT